jgi:hypothetical protein
METAAAASAVDATDAVAAADDAFAKDIFRLLNNAMTSE